MVSLSYERGARNRLAEIQKVITFYAPPVRHGDYGDDHLCAPVSLRQTRIEAEHWACAGMNRDATCIRRVLRPIWEREFDALMGILEAARRETNRRGRALYVAPEWEGEIAKVRARLEGRWSLEDLLDESGAERKRQ